MILLLVTFHKLLQVNRLVCNILGALLVSFETKCVAALVHINRTKSEAKDVELAGLSGTLTIALAVNQLLVFVALGYNFKTWLHARAIVINHAFWAHGSAHIALSHDEAGRALRVPLLLAHLAILALLLLTIAAPQGQWFVTTFFDLLEELGASEVFVCRRGLLVGQSVPLLSSLLPSTLLRWLRLLLLLRSALLATS